MDRLCIFVPKSYIRTIDMFVGENKFPNRSEAIRVAIRNLIQQQVEMDKILNREKQHFFNKKNEIINVYEKDKSKNKEEI